MDGAYLPILAEVVVHNGHGLLGFHYTRDQPKGKTCATTGISMHKIVCGCTCVCACVSICTSCDVSS